jgi:hypothetical protein
MPHLHGIHNNDEQVKCEGESAELRIAATVDYFKVPPYRPKNLHGNPARKIVN